MFSAILPTRKQTALLRACLYSGESGHQAWKVFQKHVDDFTSLARESKEVTGLLPLLYHSLRSNNTEVEKDLLSYLRTAYVHEQLRHQVYREVCRGVLSAFTTEGISTLALKGAAFAYTVYDDPVLRHCHDIDLLVRESDLSRVVHLLPPLGFVLASQATGAEWREARAEHTSGLPLALHRFLFRVPLYNEAMSDFWERSEVRGVAEVPTPVLSPADSLLHMCGHAFSSSSRQSLRWVCDGWLIIDRSPQLDWDLLLDRARRSFLALPLSVTLGYLAEELQSPIPSIILERLDEAATERTGFGRDLAVAVARASTPGGLPRLIRKAGTWRGRARLLWWSLFPSTSFMRWFFQVRRTWLLPLYYLVRPLGYLADRVKSYFRRHGRSSP